MKQHFDGTAFELNGKEKKSAVALIHGLGLNRKMWFDFVPKLQRDWLVLTYDLYGHGDSDAPPETPSLELFARQLKNLIDWIGIQRCAAIGFSLGGMINRRLAIDHPQSLESLVILNSPHLRSPVQQRLVEQSAAESALGGTDANLDAMLSRWFTAEYLANEQTMVQQVREWILSNDPSVYAQCRMVLAKGVKELIGPEPPINLPTLIMTCENDSGSTPEMSHSIAAEISGADLTIVPHLKHLGLLENPRVFLRHMAHFLRERTSSQSGDAVRR